MPQLLAGEQAFSRGPGTGSATCTVNNLGADNYIVKLELLENSYYLAPVENVVVTVVLGGTGFTTGGGWLNEPNLGSRSNFGFTVKYLKNANIQGNSLYVHRRTVSANSVINPAGGFLPSGVYNWIIKGNAMSGMTTNCTTTTPKVCTASFSGKNNITAVNRATGVAYSLGGNYNLQVDVTDNSEPGSSPGAGPDTYAIRVWDTSTGTYYQPWDSGCSASYQWRQHPSETVDLASTSNRRVFDEVHKPIAGVARESSSGNLF